MFTINKPICLIYCNDGFDIATLFNLIKMYAKFGFNVIFTTRKIINCNLLVIPRGDNIDLPIDFSNKIPIHIYNYVGNNIVKIIEKISSNPYIVLAPSRDLLEQSHVEENRGFIAAFPVYPEYWTDKSGIKIENSKYDLVHIGNKKLYSGTLHDQYAIALDKLISQDTVHLWGRGWDKSSIDANKYHGSIAVLNLKYIYSRTDIALGLMYPFQRELGTFSERFWQAPLNGTILLSEPTRYIGVIPGVFETDLQNIDRSIRKKYSKQEIADASSKYWSESTFKLEEYLLNSFNELPPTDDVLKKNYFNKISNLCWWGAYMLKAKFQYFTKLEM
jgi:hypothetical protein